MNQISSAENYDLEFYSIIEDGSHRSAKALVPKVLKILPKVKSVVDFGCGNGVWLAEFQLAGIRRIFGLDFGIGVNESLLIDADRYKSADLGLPITVIDFDLCASLEVAEHLPADTCDTFVRNLAEAAPRILFSAAIPNQGGHHHLNEQQPSYWVEKFEQNRFRCFDVVRPMIWNDDEICWWYRQNTLIFLRDDLIDDINYLSKLPSFHNSYLVHPSAFQSRHRELLSTIKQYEGKQ
jgi:SAM-dependent methyltransferase